MFARTVTMQLKPNTAPDFTRLVDSDLIPMLRKHGGFRDEIVFVNPGATSAVAISLWDSKEHAENYSRTGYSEVLKTLEKVIEGSPKVEAYQVSNSTLQKATLAAKA
jgi:heme-degrading monooxygenase HmoA